MYKRKNQQKKKPAKLVSIICTARNGQFISMSYGIILFFLPSVHLFKNCWQWFLSIYEGLEHNHGFSSGAFWGFFFYFLFRWMVLLSQRWHIRFTTLLLPFFIIKRMKSRTEPVSPYSGNVPAMSLPSSASPSLTAFPSHSHLLSLSPPLLWANTT